MTTTTNSGKGKSNKGKPKATTSKKPLTKGQWARVAVFSALAGAGLTVSLPHLASEVAQLTGAGIAASWFTAVVIDMGLCAAKAHISAGGPKRAIAWALVASCTLLSVALNCHAFLSHATDGFGQVAAIGFGVFIPLFVVAMSFLASETVLNHK